MGLIHAVVGSTVGVLGDQWKEYFYCDSLPADVLVVKGQKRVSAKSSNRSTDNIISNGSIVAVAEGQCMLIVENGKVVDLCAVPGEYKYDASTEPSLFDGGNLGSNIKAVFANIGKRITFGGEAPKDQRVYYFNIKEISGNKYGTPSPVPFRVVDERAGIDMDISVKCFGEYSYKITNPMLFFANVCGNVSSAFNRSEIDSQLKSELLTALQPAFARISELGIRYSAVPAHTTELAQCLREQLTAEWSDVRGIEICKVGVSSIKASEEDERTIKELQKSAAFMDPTRAAAHLVNTSAENARIAAGNAAGAAVGVMGMNAVNSVMGGGLNPADLYAAGAAAKTTAPAADSWVCPKCGKTVTGKFCPECGTQKPAPAGSWTCPKCGKVNTGKFCDECGTAKPAGAKCPKCGWESDDPTKTPKFCPECGTQFNA